MIRPATHSDIGELLVLAEAMHAESSYSRFPFAPGKLAALFRALIDGAGCLFVAEDNGQAIGVAAGYCEEFWFADARVAGEYGIFVLPGHRGSRAGVELLRHYVAWCKAAGADLIQAGITTGVTLERTVKVYRSIGFEPTGTVLEYKGA
ncbi:GNAT family N-acetyltransferase [Stenotrophomonas maltophilia]|nr:GNAT family N-acetyltransferase [Stenotrophomonas maltophilia]HED4877215.1 GNAT family N-acetyltransferase [Stenotrophomonas maltophilia]